MAANSDSLLLTAASSQYAHVADTVPLSTTGDMSIAAWIKMNSLTGDMCIASKFYGATSNRSYIFTVTTTSIVFYQSSTGTNLGGESVAVTWSTGVWTHVAFTKSGSTLKFYINGVQTGADQTSSVGATIFDSTADFAIGADEVQGTAERFFDGRIDEVVVTNSQMTQTEINNLYAGWKATDKVANIVGYWQLNNDYTDLSGNAQTLTASASAPSFSTDVPFANYAGVTTGAAFLQNFV